MDPCTPVALDGSHPIANSVLARHYSASTTPFLPDDALKTNVVEVPTDAEFITALNEKAGASNNIQHDATQWFKSGTAQGLATLPNAMPIPLHLAMDAYRVNVLYYY